MSHIATINLEIHDLEVLASACRKLGLELARGQHTYKWYGRIVESGERILPEGYTLEDLGNCEHAIKVPDSNGAYEIGVVSRRDGKRGYTLLWDNWNRGKSSSCSGKGMVDYVGDSAQKLKQHYAAEMAMKTARHLGHRVIGSYTKEDGSMVVKIQQ